MKIISISENKVEQQIISHIFRSIFPNTHIDQAENLLTVQELCLKNRYDIVISDVCIDNIFTTDWPDFVCNSFPETKLVFLYSEKDGKLETRQEASNDLLFINKNLPCQVFCKLMREYLASHNPTTDPDHKSDPKH